MAPGLFPDRKAIVIELGLIFGLGVAVFALSANFDMTEQVIDFLDRHEGREFDELLVLSGYLVFALIFFSVRRWRESFRSAVKEREYSEELQKSLAEVKQLRGIIPICASCKKVRDSKGYWHQVESYIGEHSDAEFSHGICESCERKLYPDLFKENGERVEGDFFLPK